MARLPVPPAPKWQPGALVVLRSGGPVMVVEAISLLGLTHCTWFNDYKDLQRAYFKPSMLEEAPDMVAGR